MTEATLLPADLSELGNHDNMLQTGFWGMLKSGFGWKALAFRYTLPQSDNSIPLLVLTRNLGAGQSLAYVPHGPMLGAAVVSGMPELSDYWNLTAELARMLKPFLPSGCMFVRFDPPWGISIPSLSDGDASSPVQQLSPESDSGRTGFKKSMMDIQPPSTVMLNLNRTEEELLAGMKSKTRYNIRLAAKKGVEVRISGIEALPAWYRLYRITAERDRIALHSYDYYERIFTLADELTAGAPGSAPELHLLEAVIEEKTEAGIIVCFQGAPGKDRRATYLYGASSNDRRNYMPSYALQWEAIKLAGESGCTEYDFFGIPPADDPSHPMHGLYRFKTGFGGNIIHRPGCWDYPYKQAAYGLFSAAEKARNYYYKNIRKR